MEFAKTIVIKPDMDCNLRCKYCYEFARSDITEVGLDVKHYQLNIERLERLILRTARLFPESHILWMMHGGEPLINGIEYFRRFIDCLRQANKEYDVRFEFALQTNALLLTSEWIQLFEENLDLMSERIVSVSIDGPRNINDASRVSRTGRSSFDRTMAAIELVRNSNLKFTTISVVGTHNLNHVDEVYQFIRDIKPYFSKFIPCYNFTNDGLPEKLGITPLQYADFMCRIFDLWLHDGASLGLAADKPDSLPESICNDLDEGQTSTDWFVIDPIVTIISKLTGVSVTWCEYRDEKCDNFIAIYPDGNMWLCDTFNQDLLRNVALVGNINTVSDACFMRSIAAPNQCCDYSDFYQQYTSNCSKCDMRAYCNGGCIAVRSDLKNRSEQLFGEYCLAKHKLIRYIERGVNLALSQS